MLSIVIPADSDQSTQFAKSRLHFQTLEDVEVIYVPKAQAKSRAERLNIGFHKARGSMILFYHPRSLIEPEGLRHLQQRANQKIWGGFTHSFDQKHWLLKFTSWY